MMRWVKRAILAVILIALGVWVWNVFFPSPEHVIRKRLAELAKSASFGSKESPLAAAENSYRVGSFFTSDVDVRLELPGGRVGRAFSGREELVQASIGMRPMLGGLQVEFYDVTVAVAPDKQSAEVNLTLKARAAIEKDPIVQEMRLLLNKGEGKWKIKRVETVKTLS